MANIKNVVLLAAGLLAAIALVVGLVLRHYIGGFIRTVEREAREEQAERDREDAARAGNAAAESQSNDDTGVKL